MSAMQYFSVLQNVLRFETFDENCDKRSTPDRASKIYIYIYYISVNSLVHCKVN